MRSDNRKVPKGHYWLGVSYAKEFKSFNSLNELAEMNAKPPPQRNLEYGKVCPQPVRYLQDGSIYPPLAKQDDSNNMTLYGMMDVNCLSVNIFTPLFATDPPTEILHPVLVYFAGGPYHLNGGSSRRYGLHGPIQNLVTPAEMVVVIVQSRLGPLGYYRSPDAPSNWSPPGLLDQLLAMKWLKANVAKFGGDPQRVTLMGESGGACGVSMLALAAMQPGNNDSISDLFQRVVLHDGVADTCISKSGSRESNSRLLEKRLCGKSTTPRAIKHCMYRKSWRDLIEASVAEDLHWGYEIDNTTNGIFSHPESFPTFPTAPANSALHGPTQLFYLLNRAEWGTKAIVQQVVDDLLRVRDGKKAQLAVFNHSSSFTPSEDFHATPAASFVDYAFLPDYLWSRDAVKELSDKQLEAEMDVVGKTGDYLNVVVDSGAAHAFISPTLVTASQPRAYVVLPGNNTRLFDFYPNGFDAAIH